MKLPVAIPLVAAICCLGSPAMASSPDEQMVKGRGARDRSAGGSSGATAAPRNGVGERRAGSVATPRRSGGERHAGERNDGERSSSERRRNDGENARANNRRDDGGSNQRYAVRRPPNRNNSPVIVRRDSRPDIHINIGSAYRPRYYAPSYYDRWARSYYRWSPLGYAPWSLIYGSIGFSNFGFYGAYGSPYPYSPYVYSGPWHVSGYDIGGVRLKIRPRDAQVFVDGYYAGLVDDFDGTFQSLRLDQGGHKIEIHMPGYEDLELDVHVQPGRTLTLQEDLRPRP